LFERKNRNWNAIQKQIERSWFTTPLFFLGKWRGQHPSQGIRQRCPRPFLLSSSWPWKTKIYL